MITHRQFGRSARSAARVLAVSVVVFGAGLPAAAHHIDKQFAVQSHPVVTVHNVSGTVTIHSWQKPVVEVVADHVSNKVEVDALQKGNLIEVTTHLLSEDVSPAELHADYEITIPEQTALQIHNDSGSVLVDRVLGDMILETIAANVELQRVSGYLSVRTVGGSFTCVECTGRIEVHSIGGNISVLGTESSNVHAQTSSGDILLDSELLPNGIYRLKNYSGRIEVRFSPTDSFDLSATSIYGKVESEATLKPPAHVSQHLPRGFAKSLFGTFNEGKAKVELTSFSGTIQIRKRE